MKAYRDTPRLLRIFLCHSSGDKQAVREIYARLTDSGFEPWLDEEKLLPGQRWRTEIPKAVEASDLVIICLSKAAISKAGYVQREVKYALDVALEQPEDSIFLIPLRLEKCDVPDSLSDWQWVDYYEPRGYARLKLALDFRAEALGINKAAGSVAEEPRTTPVDSQPPRPSDVTSVKVSTAVNETGERVLPHAIGIETLGGVFTKMIPEGSVLPHRLTEIFSTATDNQISVEIHILAGLRPLAQQNFSLGKFYLVGIPPAPRGIPRIELTFDVGADGELTVSAMDLATRRQQEIRIGSPSGESKEAVEKVLREARQYSEEDKQKLEELDLRNKLDGMIYMLQKTFNENFQVLSKTKAAEIQSAIDAGKETVAAGGIPRLKESLARTEAASHDFAATLYSDVKKTDE